MQIPNRPVVLIVYDGFGIAPVGPGNPIRNAPTPTFDALIEHYPTVALQASGEAVGLPWGEMGNSEVGHLNLGSGKIIYQSLPRISRAIADGSFYSNAAFQKAIKHVAKNDTKLHLLGMVSNGGVHSSIDHLFALLELCQKSEVKEVYLHVILDGRDTTRDSGVTFVQKLQDKLAETKVGKIATISGRYYAMDRDNRWEREEKAYRAMVDGEAESFGTDPVQLIKASYAKKVYDEEFMPAVIGTKGKPTATIADGDAVIFFNFRPDRARQLTKVFSVKQFSGFKRSTFLSKLCFVTMTEYDKTLPVDVAFPPELITNPIARVISDAGLKQLHIAETEKYAHVTYFFNGGNEDPFKHQDNLLIPSPRVASYDKKPEMSAPEVTEKLLAAIDAGKHDFIVANFANPDMVGHTGNYKATYKAITVIDTLLKKVIDAVLEKNGMVFITADHGNAEQMINPQTGEMDKEHTTNPVPFFAIANQWKDHLIFPELANDHDLSVLQPTGILSDVPVTILTYMGIKPPEEMSGNNLLMT
ncbi:MAG: 2,3-bisphosphoglycerate-independent phosphoglycerate mutase [Candidatus Kerfeldbacteria bacterium]|nr:2,3-bisphosphoglycerate-independent phosphoglycerate mutase [Candidatus Kerfeldbacteria bacterium]